MGDGWWERLNPKGRGNVQEIQDKYYRMSEIRVHFRSGGKASYKDRL